MATDPKVIELQKQLQLAGQNKLVQSGVMDEATRQAVANINKTQGYGKGVGESAVTTQLMDYLSQYKPKTAGLTVQPKQTQQAMSSSYPTVTDNSPMINQQYDSTLNALRSKIQQSILAKQSRIGNVSQQYQPYKNQNDVNASQNLKAVLEQNANSGDRGGVGRQNTLMVNTSRDNNLNSINLQQENDINGLKDDIANLTLEGDIQGANIQAEKLKALISNNQYMDTQNYARQQDQFQNGLSLAGLTGNYNGQRTLSGQQMDRNTLENDRNYNRSVLESDRSYNYQKQRDAIEDSFSRGQLSLSQRNAALNQAEFNYRKEQDSLDRQAKGNTTQATNYEPYTNTINDLFIDKTMGGIKDTASLRKYIINLNLDDSQTDYLLRMYGLPTN